MNYYNPYFYSAPINMTTQKAGLFSSLFNGKLTLGGFLNGAQRVLNFANQAIPLVKQVKPMIGNAKTMFRVMNEFKKVEKNTNINNIKNTSESKKNSETIETKVDIDNANSSSHYENGPTFFI